MAELKAESDAVKNKDLEHDLKQLHGQLFARLIFVEIVEPRQSSLSRFLGSKGYDWHEYHAYCNLETGVLDYVDLSNSSMELSGTSCSWLLNNLVHYHGPLKKWQRYNITGYRIKVAQCEKEDKGMIVGEEIVGASNGILPLAFTENIFRAFGGEYRIESSCPRTSPARQFSEAFVVGDRAVEGILDVEEPGRNSEKITSLYQGLLAKLKVDYAEDIIAQWGAGQVNSSARDLGPWNRISRHLEERIKAFFKDGIFDLCCVERPEGYGRHDLPYKEKLNIFPTISYLQTCPKAR